MIHHRPRHSNKGSQVPRVPQPQGQYQQLQQQFFPPGHPEWAANRQPMACYSQPVSQYSIQAAPTVLVYNQFQPLRILTWNCFRLNPTRQLDLEILLQKYSPDVAIVTEVYRPAQEVAQMTFPGYTCSQCPRPSADQGRHQLQGRPHGPRSASGLSNPA